MKSIVYNMGYFLKEAKTLFKIDLTSNILSILSIGLIFFILALVISGWDIMSFIVETVEREAEINVYYKEGLSDTEISKLLEDIRSVEGVGDVKIVDEEESYLRMKDILGDEAHILELFEENPFSPFIEVQINIAESDVILRKLKQVENIEYIRDNKRVLDRLNDIVSVIEFVGILVVVAVGISTLMVVSHIIRQGIYNNRDQINTLKLLGAPQPFIDFPFILEGFFLTLIGGLIASILLFVLLNYGYGQVELAIPFIPLPAADNLIRSIVTFTLVSSAILGIIGSLLGVAKQGEGFRG